MSCHFRFLGNNPIFIQLENDPSVSKRFVEIIFAAQVVISGVNVQTPENMGLRAFSAYYASQSLQYDSPLVYLPVNDGIGAFQNVSPKFE